jgi:hypothetical protein
MRQKCTTKQVNGPVEFRTASRSAHAKLSRGRVVYATGYACHTHGGLHTTLLAARRLRAARYTLTLTSRHRRGTLRTRSQITIT